MPVPVPRAPRSGSRTPGRSWRLEAWSGGSRQRLKGRPRTAPERGTPSCSRAPRRARHIVVSAGRPRPLLVRPGPATLAGCASSAVLIAMPQACKAAPADSDTAIAVVGRTLKGVAIVTGRAGAGIVTLAATGSRWEDASSEGRTIRHRAIVSGGTVE